MTKADETPWLTDEERVAWFTLASLVTRLDTALDTQLRRDAGVRHFDYVVLATLSDAPERTMRMSELAALASGSLPRLSQVVTRLEAKGWLRRTPDPTNGRYTLATLTDTGHAAVTAAAPTHVREVRRLVFDPLTKAQVQQLTSIGQRIIHAIDPTDRCPVTPPPAAPPTDG
ncbi:MarR family transcriptional regulator [Amycolatopsis rhabdoformis]|uniref:MarR family transcriptional regulator n=1 Tax=Amycolatopsis rhabdoformis TaxID=1448059 RepID=A0ABZ1IFI9_9PSEU|nr:MarR family transcriptional regulator [Amycolatopsis rhabdoformis]WSE32468.1 MarR family transcriptional regulator [Amycolatopsis rhabdoformis]